MTSVSLTSNDLKPNQARPPSKIWTYSEGRAIFELASFYLTQPLLSALPQGDGHPVLVLPGFMAANGSTKPMRRLLNRLGYSAHGWDGGRNIIVDNSLVDRLHAQIARLAEEKGRKVSLVGWSLGGTLAREFAKLQPENIRTVISLGSPINDGPAHSSARRLFEFFNGAEPEPARDGRFVELNSAPPVPTTSIFTKTDGVVHWPGSIQKPSQADSENIQVYASHCGLGFNPSVMIAIADRLRQPEDEWCPFEPEPMFRWMFPNSKVGENL